MPRDRDDDALTWDGDDDPTLASSAVTNASAEAPVDASTSGVSNSQISAASALPEGWRAVGRGSDRLSDADAAADAASSAGAQSPAVPAPAGDADMVAGEVPTPATSAMGNAALLATGVLAGIYLLYTVGWIIGGLRLRGTAQFLIDDGVYLVALGMAIAAPLVWFGATWLLTAASRTWVRYAWLVGGVLLLIPWPFIMMGAVGQ